MSVLAAVLGNRCGLAFRFAFVVSSSHSVTHWRVLDTPQAFDCASARPWGRAVIRLISIRCVGLVGCELEVPAAFGKQLSNSKALFYAVPPSRDLASLLPVLDVEAPGARYERPCRTYPALRAQRLNFGGCCKCRAIRPILLHFNFSASFHF